MGAVRPRRPEHKKSHKITHLTFEKELKPAIHSTLLWVIKKFVEKFQTLETDTN